MVWKSRMSGTGYFLHPWMKNKEGKGAMERKEREEGTDEGYKNQ